jgi:hypothetical protein
MGLCAHPFGNTGLPALAQATWQYGGLMSGENKVALALSAVSVTIALVLYFLLGWPLWAVIPTGVVLLILALAVRNLLVARNDEAADRAYEARQQQQQQASGQTPVQPTVPAPVAAEPAYRRETIPAVALPSAWADYNFLFTATVFWELTPNNAVPPHANPAALAIDAVLNRARQIVVTQIPTEVDFVQYKLGVALGSVIREQSRQVEAWAVDVTLSLTAEDQARLRKLSEVRKDEVVWEHERNYERNKRAYLRDDVLKDTGSAVVWWMARADKGTNKALEESVNLIGPLAQLSAAANNTEVAALYRHLVPPSVRQPSTLPAADLTELALFAEQAAATLNAMGRQDVADEIRQRFNSPVIEPLKPGHTEAAEIEDARRNEHVAWPGQTRTRPA